MKIIGTGWDNAVNPERTDIVFLNRNKVYGGYILRKNHEKIVAIAFGLATAFLSITIAAPYISKRMHSDHMISSKNTDHGTVVTLADAPLNDEKPEVIRIEKPQTQVLVKAISLDIPQVVDDIKVTEETQMHTQADIADFKNIGSKDVFNGADIESYNPISETTTSTEIVKEVINTETPQISVQQQPEYIDGNDELFPFIGHNLQYPAHALELGIEGSVSLQFIVERDGSVTSVNVVQDRISDDECIQEATRVIKLLKFRPGKQNGIPVRVIFTIPVHFKIRES